MTPSTSSSVTEHAGAGTRARPKERPGRCRAPKLNTGLPCRRDAGAGTEHFGRGPCSDHDEGWVDLQFSEDFEAQDAFIAAVAEDQTKPTRELIEPLGYHKRDVNELELIDPDFRARLEEARGQDLETLRREAWRRAIVEHSDRLLELLLKMKDPEAAVLRQSHTRFDGKLDVRAAYADYTSLRLDGISLERQRQLEACVTEFDYAKAIIGWMNPAADAVPREGRPALELLEGGTT